MQGLKDCKSWDKISHLSWLWRTDERHHEVFGDNNIISEITGVRMCNTMGNFVSLEGLGINALTEHEWPGVISNHSRLKVAEFVTDLSAD